MGEEITLTRPTDVEAALASPALVPPVAPAGIGTGAVAGLRAAMARFSTGEDHAGRRAAVLAVIERLDPSELRRAAAERTARCPGASIEAIGGRLPVAVLAAALGVEEDDLDAVVGDVRQVVEVIGRHGDTTPAADAAAERLLARFAGHDGRTASAAVPVPAAPVRSAGSAGSAAAMPSAGSAAAAAMPSAGSAAAAAVPSAGSAAAAAMPSAGSAGSAAAMPSAGSAAAAAMPSAGSAGSAAAMPSAGSAAAAAMPSAGSAAASATAAVAVVSVLYQAHDATAALLAETWRSRASGRPRASAVRRTVRTAVADTEVGGTTIPAGATVVLGLGAADLRLELGAGPHRCPGAAVAQALVDGILDARADGVSDRAQTPARDRGPAPGT